MLSPVSDMFGQTIFPLLQIVLKWLHRHRHTGKSFWFSEWWCEHYSGNNLNDVMIIDCCFDFIAMEWTKDFCDQTQSVTWM